MKKKPTFNWRKEPRETGLAAVTQGNRSFRLICRTGNGAIDSLASIVPNERHGEVKKYWISTSSLFGVPHRNTAGKKYWTVEQLPKLKKALRKFVVDHFKEE